MSSRRSAEGGQEPRQRTEPRHEACGEGRAESGQHRPNKRLANQVSEQRLMETIIEMATYLGWEVMHIPDGLYRIAAKQGRADAMVGAKGYPDLTCVNPEQGRCIFMELKTQKGKVRPDQQRWLDALTAAGQRALVVRPLDIDYVEEILRGDA